MHISKIYKSIYRYYDTTTPLTLDCGKLCGAACCKSDDDETGMYLFPGEKSLFLNNPDFKIITSEFKYGENFADILICKGKCKREERPLSCRIFPLIPYVYPDGTFNLIFDPRAKSVCPLCDLKTPSQLNEEFVKKTRKVINLLMKFEKNFIFLTSLTDVLDDFIKFSL